MTDQPQADDDDRDSTIVRPATTVLATRRLSDDDGARTDDHDATVIRHTLQRRRDDERTRRGGPPTPRLPRSALALSAGTTLHEYRIERVLGQGGFGITYLATDLHLDASVAIKEYLPEEIAFRAHDRSVSPHASHHRDRYHQGLENFLLEARTLATFRHPNIVRVARFFEAHQTAYMVLEYERGRSLRKWWKAQGADGERLLLERLHRLLDGLAVVHAAGYLHRDIKPDNIQVRSDDGRFVLLDFGSAGQTVALADQDAVVVTPGYAPLEQYGAGEQGPWTDLYALGATLYWVVAGRKPPDAEARAAGTAMPSALELGRDRFGPHFLSAVDWALQMDPAARPRSVEQWRDHLLGDGQPARGASAPARRDESSFGAPAVPRAPAERLRRLLRRAGTPAAWPLTVKLPLLALGGCATVATVLLAAWGLSDVPARLQQAPQLRLEEAARQQARLLALRVADQQRLARGLAADAALLRLLRHADLDAEQALRQRLEALLRAQGELTAFVLADAAGRVRLAAAPDAVDPTQALAQALRPQARALASGQPFVGAAAGAALWIGEPLRDGGIVVGHLLLLVSGDAVAAVLEGGAPPRALLVDADGQQLYPAPAERPDARLQVPELAAAWRSGAAGGHLSWQAGARGEEHVAGHARVPGTRWVLLLDAPRAALPGPLDGLWPRLAWAWLLAALLALWPALRLARGLSRPLRRLAGAAQAVRDGDLGRAPLESTRRDELGRALRAFNAMVDALRQRERLRGRGGSPR
ncbi:MAG: HAMP domain-containing protein [Rubrivivax sp.]